MAHVHPDICRLWFYCALYIRSYANYAVWP